MKKMITVKVNPGIDLLLKKLAEKENRSQGQQIEKLILDAYNSQNSKMVEINKRITGKLSLLLVNINTIPSSEYNLIGISTGLSEEQCADIIESDTIPFKTYTRHIWPNFRLEDDVKTAKESFESLLKSLGVDNETWLVLSKA